MITLAFLEPYAIFPTPARTITMARRVEEVMTKDVATLPDDRSLVDAHKLMQKHNVRHLPIVEANTGVLVGMVSDRDVRTFLSPFAGSGRETEQDKATLYLKISKVMTKDPITAKPSDKLQSVVETMLQKKFDCLPVVDDQGRVSGIITTFDALKIALAYLD